MNEPQPLTKESILNQEYDDQDWSDDVIKLNDVLSAIKGLKEDHNLAVRFVEANIHNMTAEQVLFELRDDGTEEWFPIDSQSQSTDQTKTVGYLQDTDKVGAKKTEESLRSSCAQNSKEFCCGSEQTSIYNCLSCGHEISKSQLALINHEFITNAVKYSLSQPNRPAGLDFNQVSSVRCGELKTECPKELSSPLVNPKDAPRKGYKCRCTLAEIDSGKECKCMNDTGSSSVCIHGYEDSKCKDHCANDTCSCGKRWKDAGASPVCIVCLGKGIVRNMSLIEKCPECGCKCHEDGGKK